MTIIKYEKNTAGDDIPVDDLVYRTKEKPQDNVKKSHITTQKEPKSEKTTQDVQKNCLSLTEQWKKGELDMGYYYFRHTNDNIYFGWFESEYIYESGYSESDVKEVLAPVPSYEEWQDLELNAYKEGWSDGCEMTEQRTKKHYMKFYKKKYDKKIHKLKELLKECKDKFVSYKKICEQEELLFALLEVNGLLTKIDEVLK